MAAFVAVAICTPLVVCPAPPPCHPLALWPKHPPPHYGYTHSPWTYALPSHPSTLVKCPAPPSSPWPYAPLSPCPPHTHPPRPYAPHPPTHLGRMPTALPEKTGFSSGPVQCTTPRAAPDRGTGTGRTPRVARRAATSTPGTVEDNLHGAVWCGARCAGQVKGRGRGRVSRSTAQVCSMGQRSRASPRVNQFNISTCNCRTDQALTTPLHIHPLCVLVPAPPLLH